MSPKTKDVKSYKCPRTGQLMKLPTRHMLYSQKEAFALFNLERNENERGSHVRRAAIFAIKYKKQWFFQISIHFYSLLIETCGF